MGRGRVLRAVTCSPYMSRDTDLVGRIGQVLVVEHIRPQDIFVFIDGRLVLEVTDPTPIDTTRYGMIGFEAYTSAIQIRHPAVRQIVWHPRTLAYPGSKRS